MYNYDIEKIKNSLTEEQVFNFLIDAGGDPRWKNKIIISRTICHGGNQHKLYYYPDSHLFHCYTDCSSSFDIFELVKKIKELETSSDYPLPSAIKDVANYFGIEQHSPNFNLKLDIDDYLIKMQNYDKIKNKINFQNQVVELKLYNENILNNLPHPLIGPWLEEGISAAALERFEIAYEPSNCSIVIPHRDISGSLIGIRTRTLIEEIAQIYGKYLPLKICNEMYNHPLSFNLYGIYQNKENIKRIKKAIIVEGEKSVLQLDSILGVENNIGVACCGSNIVSYQIKLLLDLGVEEIIIAFDRQYQEIGDFEYEKLTKHLTNIHNKYGNIVKITFIFDVNNILPYKASPTDTGKENFLFLLNNRENLY